MKNIDLVYNFEILYEQIYFMLMLKVMTFEISKLTYFLQIWNVDKQLKCMPFIG